MRRPQNLFFAATTVLFGVLSLANAQEIKSSPTLVDDKLFQMGDIDQVQFDMKVLSKRLRLKDSDARMPPTMNAGDQDSQIKFKVISKKLFFIGPDGKRQEIKLDEGADLSSVDLEELLHDTANVTPARFFIGLGCQSVAPALASQLDLDPSVGLLVDQIVAGQPAANSGIQQYDVLISAAGNSLSTIEDLIQAVQVAGKKGESISLELYRQGKKISVDVKPEDDSSKHTPPQDEEVKSLSQQLSEMSEQLKNLQQQVENR